MRNLTFFHYGSSYRKHESAIEIDSFQYIVGDKGFHQCESILTFLEFVIAIAYKGISFQQVSVCFPLVKDLVTLFGATDRIQHVTVALAVYTFLKGLDMEA